MRRSLIALAATALLAVGACSGSAATSAPTAAPPAAGGTAIAIKNFAFNPATVTVKAGSTITWTNGDDTPHTVTFDDASITGSGSLNNGATFQLTPTTAGSFTYHCKIHPSMKGTITVS